MDFRAHRPNRRLGRSERLASLLNPACTPIIVSRPITISARSKAPCSIGMVAGKRRNVELLAQAGLSKDASRFVVHR